jgi:hypothetical protein
LSAEKLEAIAPGRLSIRLRTALAGHHPLFETHEIRDAFSGPDRPMGRPEAEAVGAALLAMAYAVGRPADPRTLAAQEEARRAGAGMWAKGAPRRVLTSLHSLDEAEPGAAEVHDRVVDVATGRAREVRHASRYGTCEERCRGEGPDRTCMTYVPFARRYRDPPACLRAAPP